MRNLDSNRVLLALAGSALLALSGCAGLTAEATIDYDGDSNGSHSDTADCDADGTLTGTGDITDGRLYVSVKDGQGNTIFDRSFSGVFDLGSIELDGHAGTWTLLAERRGDDLAGDEFNGAYEFFLDCTSSVAIPS